jgi:hypothetical protein
MSFISFYNKLLGYTPDIFSLYVTHIRKFKQIPKLKNPETFAEKVLWRKMYQKDPRFPLFADKIAVKSQIEPLIGREHIIETLWVGQNPDEIPYETLKPPYVIKVNHNSGGNIFIRKAEDVDREKISAFMRHQLSVGHSRRYREWGYLNIPRGILIEQMLETPSGECPDDYKFFVYHGRVHFIQHDQGRFTNHVRAFYDREWGRLPVSCVYPVPSHITPQPDFFDKMVELAEKIGSLFDFIRVDFYSVPGGVKFGEATFYPEAGIAVFKPDIWNRKFGDPWVLTQETF